MSNPFARLATAWPICPIPMMPRVAPETSLPTRRLGCQFFHFPERRKASASMTLRAVMRIRVMVRSAVAAVRTPGVLVTRIPLLVASATSMLS